jgi:inhibitor of KinA sporulation pathway (predicted exonuclease)
MQFIVLDLEWNQPTSYQSSVYRKIGDSLLFEVIQIGAVKLNDRFDILDAISIPVRPTHYLTIHPRVRRMTRLGQEELCDAPEFMEAMDRFADWCGEDYVFLTWGCDDVSVLQQNIDFFQFQRPLPMMYDIQRLYAQALGLKANQQMGLKSAMEQLEIQEDQDRSFHNAMHDAYYTALVLKKLPDPSAVLAFEEQPRKFCHTPKRSRVRITQTVPSVAAALASPAIQTPECPTCKKPTLLQTEVIPQAVGKYTALSKCAQHGLMLVKIVFALLPDGQKGMHMSVLPANHQSKAYVHTKELQYQYKRKRGDFDHVDVEDVGSSFGSNLPFEDA